MKFLNFGILGGILAIVLLGSPDVSAQCLNDNILWGSLNPSGVGVSGAASTTSIMMGQYATVTVCQGATYTFATCGSSFDTQITLFQASPSTYKGFNDDACGLQSEVTWTADFSGVLNVVVDFYPCSPLPSPVTLTVTQNTACGAVASMTNDDPCSAIFIPAGSSCSYSTYTNTGATSSLVFPAPPCASYSGGDVWFKTVVPASGSLTLDTDEGDITDGGMMVYTSPSCSGPYTPVLCDDDNSSNGLMPSIGLSGLTPGDTILIRFWEYGGNTFGTFGICAFDPTGGLGGNPCGSTIPDECNSACSLGTLPAPNLCSAFSNPGQGQVIIYNLSNVGATAANPYSYVAGCSGGGNMAAPAADVWYSFVAGAPVLDVDISGNISNPNIGLWEGSCGSLTPRGCATGSSGSLSTTFDLLTPGNTYFLQISGGSVSDQGTFDLTLENYIDCNTCITGATLTAVPAPVGGTYPPGTTVTFTLAISSWNYTLANWLHGVVPVFGNGWNTSTLTTVPSTSCDGAGNWSWYSSNTSSATGATSGPGFYYDTFWGGPLDGVSGNNYGDNCGGGWVFSWTIQTNSGPCSGTGDLSIVVNTTGDGETGSWTSVACTTDPTFGFSASCSNTLPVDFTTFSGDRVAEGNMLKWVTGGEINSDRFEVERSLNGQDFEEIGQVPAAGNSSEEKDYAFLDDWHKTGTVYYRLKQVDKNGLFEYSDVINIRHSVNDLSITKLYPNPANQDLFADLFIPEEGMYKIEIIDLMGRSLSQTMHSLNSGAQKVHLNVADLEGGVYFVHIRNTADGVDYKEKFVK